MVRLEDGGVKAMTSTQPGIDRALRALESSGVAEVPLDTIDGPVADWLDDLIGRAEASGLTVTWLTRDHLLYVVDMEA